MSEEVTHLIIKVSSQDAETAKARLDRLGYSAKEAEGAMGGLSKASDSLMGTIKSLLGPLAAFVTVSAGLTKLVNTSRQFEVLNAQLKTATGSSQNAAKAFEALVQFAQQTPFDLAQTVDAFIKLTNLGLTPSERALRAYGNTASAMGKTLDEMVLAVSNATVGQFLNLRQFGIKARQESDGIAFIFQGTSTKVKNNAKDIEDYFIKLGESKFANSMAEKMNTLDGAISNLGDAWDVLFATIGAAGAGQLMRDGILAATTAVQDLTAMIASGQLVAYIDALFYKFAALSDGISNAFINITEVVDQAFKYWAGEGKDTADFIKKAFTEMPENIRAAMQLAGATVGAFSVAAEASAKAFVNIWIASFDLTIKLAYAAAKAIALAMTPLLQGKAATDFAAQSVAAFKQFSATASLEAGKVQTAVSGIGAAWEQSVVATLDERDAAVASFKTQIDGANQLRAAYDALQKKKADAAKGTDRLQGFKVGGDDHLATEEERRKFEHLKEQLQLEEVSIKESYDKRLTLIRDNTKVGSDLRIELEKELNSRVTAEYETAFQDRGQRVLKLEQQLREAVAAGRLSEVETLTAALLHEEDNIQASYERRRNAILDDTSLTEEARLKLLTSLENKYTQQQQDIELARRKATLSKTADFFGNLATMAGAFGAKGAKIAKAAAIVQTTIKTYESATSAYASLAGIPYIGPALGAAAAGAAIAAGMANVAQIKSQDYSGAYDLGGMIPAGKVGMVGEKGAELVRGPAVVTSRRATADLLGNGASPDNFTLIINNNAGGEASVSERQGPEGKIVEVTIEKTRQSVARGIRLGGDPIASALEQTYGLRRGAA